ncbi:type VI secretion system baseplate subunit TssK [Candidatus Poribacteria bacterium]
MAQYHKIVWSEGMFLGPHHFQQWDRYQEDILNLRLKSVMPLYWGLIDLEINRETLENGTFMLLSCHGILPNGQYVNAPEADEAPPGRTIEDHFDASLESLDVYLAIPAYRPGSPNCRLEDNSDSVETQYSRGFIQIVDENTGDNEREIPVAKKRLKILFAGEVLDAHDYIKIAELERTPTGAIVIKNSYIPTCLAVTASPRLVAMVRRLIENLTSKSDELRDQFRERGGGAYEFGAADVSNLWVFQTINSFIPDLNHFYSTERGHPEQLFRLLARFAGALTVFSVNIRPVNLPVYDHKDLSRCFGELEEAIEELLRLLGPTAARYALIPLKEARESIYEGTIADYLLTPSYKFYLSVKGEGDAGDLITELPRRVKIASGKDVDFLIGKALRGIALSYIPTPPTAIPRKAGCSYFNLDPRSEFWNEVQQSKILAIYLPDTFRSVELELMAVED